MGFYGNITNTSNTTFSFDRIYPNRLSMDANVNNDGIFIGRYVLVEYQNTAAYPVVYIKDSKFYSSPNCEAVTQIKFLTGTRADNTDVNKDGYFDGVYENEIVQNYVNLNHNDNNITFDKIEYYKCTGGIGGFATFEKTIPANQSDYIKNFGIDEMHYSNEKSFKGYDSTVWTKASVESEGRLITKYVQIADLNSVVPTFDITADAPTMTPITPHFDADSTNVYYKLHIQPQWGMRVAAADGNSDVETYWTRENYNPQTGLSTKEYWDKNQANWITYTNEEEIKKFDAAIYYNKAGFEEYTRTHIDNIDLDDNIINIEPTGESGNLYSNHNQSNSKSTAKDIQEIRINLPAIGNMMSDAWDIIHGSERDDYRGDNIYENNQLIKTGSLQGRLDAFGDIKTNQIPLKRHDDGTIIGSKINNNEEFKYAEKNINQEILDEKVEEGNQSLNHNDPWIRVKIDTNNLEGGKQQGDSVDQSNNNGILIQHTFHSTEDSETSLNKNTGEASVTERQNYIHAIKDNNNIIIQTPINAKVGNKTDEIKLYTPYVDATGHVVGKNIETVTLPYGYKHFKTDGLSPKDVDGKDIVSDLYSTVNYTSTEDTKTTGDIANSSVAHNTQDVLTINPHNKWIQTKIEDTENDGDMLTIAHEIHSIDERYDSNTNLNELSIDNENKEGNLTIYDWDYDEAGHINKKRKHTYTLPYGFKTINVGNNTTESAAPDQTDVEGETADNTQDSLTFTPTNKWIKTVATGNNEIKFGHELSEVITTDKKATDLNVEATRADSIIIPDWSYDAAGHITSKQKHEYILPYGYKSFTDGANVSTANSTQDKFNLVGDNWLQPIVSENTITYNHIGPVKPETVNAKNNITDPQFGSTFTIEDWYFDNKGHMHTSGKTHTVQFPEGSIKHPNSTSNNSDIITALDFNSKSGEISYQKDNSSTLKLTADYTNNGISAGNIAGGDTINTAFAKLEKQVIQEVSDRDTAIKTAIANLVDSAPENINTLGEIVAWLDNDGDEKIDIIKDIASNTSKIDEEIGRATAAEQELQERIEALGTAAKENKEYFATAIQGSTADTTAATIATYGDIVTHNHSEYATAAQGELADKALLKDTEFIYIEEFKDTETGEILIPEVKMTIEQLVKKVAELENEIKILKGE